MGKNIFKNVMGIEFNANFNSIGCVNFDAKDQRYFLNRNGLGSTITQNDNVKYAKKIFSQPKEGKLPFKYKVSSECIRHAMYADCQPFHNPSIVSAPQVLYRMIAHPSYITRGFVFTQKDKNSLKKSSPVTITDAIENHSWRTSIAFDFHSRSGAKDTTIKEEDDSRDTTIYYTENVGNNTYSLVGFMDLTEMQFMAADASYDRMAIDCDGGEYEQIFLNSLKSNFPSFNGGFDCYYQKCACVQDEWGERGILFDKQSVDFLVKDILKRVMNVNIHRNSAMFTFESLTITIIMDGGEKETFEITNENIDNFVFEYYQKYLIADVQKIRANKELIERQKQEQKEAKKAKKESKKQKTENE